MRGAAALSRVFTLAWALGGLAAAGAYELGGVQYEWLTFGAGNRFELDKAKEARDFPQAQYYLGAVLPLGGLSLVAEGAFTYEEYGPSYPLFVIDRLNPEVLPADPWNFADYEPRHRAFGWEPRLVLRVHGKEWPFINAGVLAGVSGHSLVQSFTEDGVRREAALEAPLDGLLGARLQLGIVFGEYRFYWPLSSPPGDWQPWRNLTRHSWTLGVMLFLL